jgi:hypothetical protein
LPRIPPSSRVLRVEEVKNFWINKLARTPVPRKPNGLYPKQQAAWQSVFNRINQTIRSVQHGDYDDEALLTMLRHNAAAWRLLGNAEKAKMAEQELREIELHGAQLATLAAQRDAARQVGEAASEYRSTSSNSCPTTTNTTIYVPSNCPQPSSGSTTSEPCEPYRIDAKPILWSRE